LKSWEGIGLCRDVEGLERALSKEERMVTFRNGGVGGGGRWGGKGKIEL